MKMTYKTKIKMILFQLLIVVQNKKEFVRSLADATLSFEIIIDCVDCF
jgi:hypothetical protein